MLSRLANISKPLALAAATLLMVISVHGVFLHKDSHATSPGENHLCTLCEIHSFHYTFPEGFGFVTETAVPVISHTYRETGIFRKTPHHSSLRGPPAGKS